MNQVPPTLESGPTPGNTIGRISIYVLGVPDHDRPFRIEVDQAKSFIMMNTPYAPDDYYCFSADLFKAQNHLFVVVHQNISTAGSVESSERFHVSSDDGLSWQRVSREQVTALIGAEQPQILSHVSE
jgi:hypothetical protein